MQQSLHQPAATVDTALALIRQKQWPQAMQLLTVLARGGNVRAMEIAGKVCMLHQQPQAALSWFRMALEAGETAARLCDMGIALSETGPQEEAMAYFQRAIASDPNKAEPYCHLGRLLMKKGQNAAAVEPLRKAVALGENYLPAMLALGEALLNCNDAEAGAAVLKQVLELDDKNATAYCNLAAALQAMGDIDGAIENCMKALKLHPDYLKAVGLLGTIWIRIGEFEAALECFHQYLAIMPGSARAHNNCGLALIKMGREAEAIEHFRKALTGDEPFAGAAVNLGSALFLSGHAEDAREMFLKACEMSPGDPQAFAGLADAEQAMGHPEAAYKAFLHTIDLAPGEPATYRRLVSMGREWPLPEDKLATLREMETHEAEMSDPDRSELHFALFRVAENADQYDEAARHLLLANAARRKAVDYDEAAELEPFKKTEAETPASLFTEKAGLGDPSEVPVFIVGMPRSGTTLLEQVLASHPDVFGAGELPDFGEVIGARPGRAPETDIPHLSAGDMQTLGRRYLKRIQARAPDAKRIVDKLPWNFRHVGYIHLLLPNARIIHIHRDPMDTCMSCFAQDFRGTLNFCYDQEELGRYYLAYQHMMAHWRAVLPEGVMAEVSYESLIDNFEPEVRRLLDFCGLDWDPACLNFYEAKRAVATASVMQVRRPLSRGSIGKWKRYGDALAPLQRVLEGAV